MSDAPISMNPNEKGSANLIYILFLAGFVTGGIAALVGVVMAYMAKDEAPDMLKTHYHNHINIFWKALAYGVLGAVLLVFLGLGLLVWLAVAVWIIIRIVKGMQALAKDEAIENPGSWTL